MQRKEDFAHNEEKDQWIEADPEMTQVVESDKDIKTAVRNILHIFTEVEEGMSMLGKDMKL